LKAWRLLRIRCSKLQSMSMSKSKIKSKKKIQ
jgi:hypothetical protein